MADKISLSAEAPVSEKIAITPDANPPVVDNQVLGERSAKIDFALGTDSPGAPEIRAALLQGREKNLREQGALQEQIKLNDMRVNLARDVFRKASEEGRTLSKAEEQTIMGLTQQDFEEAAADPETFFEKKYSQRVMDTAVTLGEDNPFLRAAAEDDDGAFFQKKHFEDILTKKEIAQKLFDDAGKNSASQSWAGYLADEAKSVIPFYTWSKMGNLDQDENNPALPGNDLRATITHLYSLPPREMAIEARKIYDRLNTDNTPLAHEFAAALVGYSSSQQFWDNVLVAGADLATFVPFGMVGRGGKAAASAVAKEGVKATGSKVAEKAAEVSTEALSKSKEMLANFTHAMMKPRAGLDTALDQMGETAKASIVDHYKRLREMGVGSKEGSWDNMAKNIPSIFNVAEVTSTSTRYFTKKAAESLNAILEGSAESLVRRLLIDPLRPVRLEGEILDKALIEVVENVELNMKHIQHSILDARIVDQDKRLGLTTFAEVDIAKKGGELFDTWGQADIHAKIDYGLIPGSYKINERGHKYYVTITRPVNETDAGFRKALKEIVTKNPRSVSNRVAEWAMKWRTPDDTLPEDIVRTLSTSVYAQAAMKKALEDFVKDIPKLGKDDNVFKLMEKQQAERNRTDPSKLGNGAETLAEFSYDFFSAFGKNPTSEQAEVYFKLRQLNDIVYAATNITQYMERSRAGVSLWSFDHGDYITGGINNIEGRMVKDIPWEHPHNFSILVLKQGENGLPETPLVVSSLGAGRKPLKKKDTLNPELLEKLNKPRLKKAERESVVSEAVDILSRPQVELPSKRDEIKQLLDQGYQVIQISRQGSRDLLESPVKGLMADKPDVRFIVAKSHRNSPLGFDILPYQEGFRFAPPETAFFLRQAIVKKNDIGKQFTYYGDRNLYQVNSKQDAEVMRDRFEQARKLFLKALKEVKGDAKGTIDEAMLEVVSSVKALKPTFKELKPFLKDFHEYVKHNLPAGVKNLDKQFWEGLEKDGKGLDPHSPILFSPTNQSLDRAHKLDDILNGEHGVSYRYSRLKDDDLDVYENSVSLQGAMERGENLWKIGNKGSVHNPIWEVERAELLHPLDAIEASAKAFVKNASMRDLTFQLAERYVAEFADVLEPGVRQLYADPIQALLDPDLFKKGLKGDQLTRLKMAMTYQERASAFLGIRSREQIWMAQKVDQLLGDIDSRFGQGFLYNAADWLLKKKDPVTRLRSMAFHAKIGMLNMKQLILQPMTLFTMAGVVGDMDIVKKTGMMIWHMNQLTRRNMIDVLPSMEKFAQKNGWQKGWFTEAHDLMKRSGFGQVEQAHVLIGDHMDFDFVKSKMEGFINKWSPMFFYEGERMVRSGALMGAYLEWRKANPLAKLTDVQRAKILKRADLLSTNMSHASRAKWQEGAWSIPTQFMGYPIRAFEQMIGKRLTRAEKMRIVAVHTATFGAPVAISGAVPLWPIHETIRQEFIEAGIDVNANALATLLNDGALGVLAEAIAGEPTNFSERFGPTGINPIKEAFTGEKTMWEILEGASGSTFAGLLAGVAPVIPWMYDALMPSKEAEPISGKAIFDATLGQISSFSNLEKMWMALNTGTYMSKRGVRLDGDVNTTQSIIAGFLGYNVKRIDLVYDLQAIAKARQDTQKKLRPSMVKSLRNTLESTNTGDASTALTDFKAKAIAGGFSPGQVKQMIKDEIKQKPALWDQMKSFGKLDPAKNDFVQALKAKYKGTQ